MRQVDPLGGQPVRQLPGTNPVFGQAYYLFLHFQELRPVLPLHRCQGGKHEGRWRLIAASGWSRIRDAHHTNDVICQGVHPMIMRGLVGQKTPFSAGLRRLGCFAMPLSARNENLHATLPRYQAELRPEPRDVRLWLAVFQAGLQSTAPSPSSGQRPAR